MTLHNFGQTEVKKDLRHLSTNPMKQTATGGTTNQYFTDLKSDVSAQINRAEAV